MKRLEKAFFVLSLVVFSAGFRCSMPGSGVSRNGITVMTYNVQNIFDAADDGSEYAEFDPSAGVWNEVLYNTRLVRLSETIKGIVRGGPDIIALQEIENGRVAEDLIALYLKGMGYSYYAFTDKEGSAVQLAVISRFPISCARVHDQYSGNTLLRPVLEADIETDMGRLYLFNNHWKSRIGGAEETEYLRIMSASVVRERVQAVAASDPSACIIVAGDLNENHDEYLRNGGVYRTALMPYAAAGDGDTGQSLYISGRPEDLFSEKSFPVLYDPWADNRSGTGSYFFGDVWETIDHILMNSAVMSSPEYTYSSFETGSLSFLFTDDNRPSAWSTRSGTGYSDHLPLVVSFTRRK